MKSSLRHVVTCFGLSLTIARSVAAPLPVEALYDLPPGHAGLAFEPTRGRLYLASPERHAVVCLNLVSGEETAVFPLTLSPAEITITPDARWLFVNEVQMSPEGSPNDQPGKIAEIDLEAGTLTREIDFQFSPRGITATDGRLLIVSSLSIGGGLPVVQLLDAVTGTLSSQIVATTFGPHTFDPSQTSVFGYGLGNRFSPVVRAFFDPVTARFTTLRKSRYGGEHPNVMLGPVYPSPDGTLLICDGKAYRGAPNAAANDMLFLKALDFPGGGFTVVRFDKLTRQIFVGGSGNGLWFFRMDTLERFQDAPAGLVLNVAYFGDWIFAVVLDPNGTHRVVRVVNPALNIETNQPPVAHFTWTPNGPTTADLVTLDGSTSTDDRDSPTELRYRWDLNGDGVWDTEFVQSPTTQFKFRVGGTNVVTLETRDRFGASAQARQSVVVAAVTDPGQPGRRHEPWQLPFALTDVVFAPARSYLFGTQRSDEVLVKVNLTNGLIEREWRLDTPPGALAFRHDGSRLYVTMTTNDPNFFDAHGGGWVGEFDPVADLRLREFPVKMDPLDVVATDSGYVILQGEGNPYREIQVYQVGTGQFKDSARFDSPAGLTLHPSETIVYASEPFDPAYIQRYDFSADTGLLTASARSTVAPYGPVFALPNGTNLLTFAGEMLTSSPTASLDMKFLFNLGVNPVKAIVPVPMRRLVGVLTGDRIIYFHDDTWLPFISLPTDQTTQYTGTDGKRVYLVSIANDTTVINSRGVPATSPAENTPPVVHVQTPTNGQVITFGQPVVLQAEADDDDGLVKEVAFYVGSDLVGNSTNAPFQFPWSPSRYGVYQVSAVARDNLDATTTSTPVTLIINDPPQVSLVNPAAGGPLLSPASFTVEAMATDADGRIVQVEFFYGPSESQITKLGGAEASPFRIELKDFISSGGLLQVVATDDRGATTSATLVLNILGLQGDDNRHPFVLTGLAAVGHANNTRAARQRTDPSFSGTLMTRTIWWQWTAPTNGIATTTTRGSSFDTAMQVLSGAKPERLTLVAANDEDPGNAPTSRVKFEAKTNTVYWFVVGGTRTDEAGDVVLNLDFKEVMATVPGQPPANDDYANSVELVGADVSVQASNQGATKETGEPPHYFLPARKSVWWSWTAPDNGNVALTTAGSDFDTVVAVYQGGPALGSLRTVWSNDDDPAPGTTSTVRFAALKGTTYSVAVDGFAGDAGNLTLRLRLLTNAPPAAPPVNDNFANRIPLAGDVIVTAGTNTYATSETGEPAHAARAALRTIWWTWTAASSGPVFLSARGRLPLAPGLDNFLSAALAVYTGDSLATLNLVKKSAVVNCLDGPKAIARFDAVAGLTYHIALDSLIGNPRDLQLVINTKLTPAFLRFLTLSQTPDGSFSLRLESSYARKVILQSSLDLKEWTTMKELDLGQAIQVVVPNPQALPERQFYRLLTFE